MKPYALSVLKLSSSIKLMITITSILPVIIVKAGLPSGNEHQINTTIYSGTQPAYVKEAAGGFEKNQGQVMACNGTSAPYVYFRFIQANTSIYLLPTSIAYQFNHTHYPEAWTEVMKQARIDKRSSKELEALRQQVKTETYRMNMVLDGANANAKVSAEGQRRDYNLYYPAGGSPAYQYEKIIYHDIYPGIDWVIYTTGKGIKYDFIVHPGADAGLIRMRFEHHEELYIDKEGNLVHGNRMGRFTEERPVSFQEGVPVTTRFSIEGSTVRFSLAAYDRQKTLTIDPARIWATYYGDISNDEGYACAVDNNGNVYLVGMTGSTTGIASGGHQVTYGMATDGFIVKFNSSGVRQWGSYYGGSSGDEALSCAVDRNGNVYMSGYTQSPLAIAHQGHQMNYGGGTTDAFLVKFNSAGVRLWGTYYGGNGHEYGLSCATDSSGNVFMAGYTNSATGIASGGHQDSYGGNTDIFLVKFDSSGVRQWGTYYGTNSPEEGYSCAVDASGNVYLAGTVSQSSTGLAFNGHQNTHGGGATNAILVKFNTDGTRIWATYYGGSTGDRGSACAVDRNGNVILAGFGASTSNIATTGAHQPARGGLLDGFLVKFDSTGIRQWGTYYGGQLDDEITFCTTDLNNNIITGGFTESINNIAAGGYQNTMGGNLGDTDAFLVKFNENGVREWGSYYGGNSQDYGYYAAADHNGDIYLAGATRSDTGIASGGHQDVFAGLVWDAFLAKFQEAPLPVTLLSFTGSRQGDHNVLRWSTSSEVNNAGFEVERSVDGLKFLKIGFIHSASADGSSNTLLQYSYTDQTSLSNCYYRLKQMDKDGKYTYSSIVLIRNLAEKELQLTRVYPNPATSALAIMVKAGKTQPATVIISDLSGRPVWKKSLVLMNGDNKFEINVSHFTAGVYQVTLIGEKNERYTSMQFVKQ